MSEIPATNSHESPLESLRRRFLNIVSRQATILEDREFEGEVLSRRESVQCVGLVPYDAVVFTIIPYFHGEGPEDYTLAYEIKVLCKEETMYSAFIEENHMGAMIGDGRQEIHDEADVMSHLDHIVSLCDQLFPETELYPPIGNA